jgi:nucleotidyltransferase/DNA polymerase involved in DNA repair
MNDKAKVMLVEIMAKHIDQLTETEKDILKARRGYLNEDQLKRYAELFEEKEVAPKAKGKEKK